MCVLLPSRLDRARAPAATGALGVSIPSFPRPPRRQGRCSSCWGRRWSCPEALLRGGPVGGVGGTIGSGQRSPPFAWPGAVPTCSLDGRAAIANPLHHGLADVAPGPTDLSG